MPIRANDKEFEETSDSEDEEEEEKENDSTNGSDLGTWLEPDLKNGTLSRLQLSEFLNFSHCNFASKHVYVHFLSISIQSATSAS